MDGKHKGGGSLVLASLVDKAGEAIYQDFRSEYNLNLLECLQGSMTPIEILILIRGLKIGSRFVAALQGGAQFIDWNVVAYQLANLTDAVNNNTYVVTAANSKRKPKQPKPSYRPKKDNRQSNNMFRTQLELAKKRKPKGG